MPTVVQSDSGFVVSNGFTVNFTAPITPGNTVLIFVRDTQGNTATPSGYTPDVSETPGGSFNTEGHYVFRKSNSTADSSQAFTQGGTNGNYFRWFEVIGLTNTSPLDLNVLATLTNVTAISASGTPGGANAVGFYSVYMDGTVSAATPTNDMNAVRPSSGSNESWVAYTTTDLGAIASKTAGLSWTSNAPAVRSRFISYAAAAGAPASYPLSSQMYF